MGSPYFGELPYIMAKSQRRQACSPHTKTSAERCSLDVDFF